MVKKKDKKIILPEFKNEDEERNYWNNFDLSKLDPKDFISASFPNLKLTSHPVSVRIPDAILFSLKEKANKINVPYQSLMKRYIAEGLIKDKI